MSIYDDEDYPLAEESRDAIYRVIANKLRIIVIYSVPWREVPGAGKNPTSRLPNMPPASAQIPVTPGLPWCSELAARPLTIGTPVERRLNPAAGVIEPGWNKRYDVPDALYAKFKETLKNSKSFVFDFGKSKTREAKGKLMAYGRKGSAQAAINFTYGWGQRCGTNDIVFKIDSCVASDARFTLLSSLDEFLPTEDTDVPFIPTIVLGLQQWRCDAEWDGNSVEDAGGAFCPTGCSQTGLDCLSKLVFSDSQCGRRQ